MQLTRSVPVVNDDWDFYFARVSGVLASIFVNLGLRLAVPDTQQPWLLWIFVDMRRPSEDGLSSSDEAPTLKRIEEALTAELGLACGAQCVGRITTDGRREFYFYGSTTDRFPAVVASALKGFGYSYEVGSKEDRGWRQYLDVLYPSPADNRRIQNRHVVEHLERKGDVLVKPRPVSHWLYFQDSKERSAFVSRVQQLGFAAIDESMAEDPSAERPFGITLERTDSVDWESINEVTLELFHMAQEHGGEYDGWETTVVRDA